MKAEEWLFDQGPNVAAITSTHVMKDGKPILLVTHYEDDHSWGFQSGHPVETREAMVVGMKEIVKHDPTVSKSQIWNLATPRQEKRSDLNGSDPKTNGTKMNVSLSSNPKSRTMRLRTTPVNRPRV